MPVAGLDIRQVQQFGVGFVVTWQKRKLDAGGHQPCGQLFDRISPVSSTAKGANHHQFRPETGVFDVFINGKRMRKPRKLGQPQVGRIARQFGARLGQGGKFGIGRRKENNICRGLARIDRLGPVRDRAGRGRKQMHQSTFSMKILIGSSA